jgi:hypothetical protein
MHILLSRLLRAARPALLLAAVAACEAGTAPRMGGEYAGSLESPFSLEGAALIEITHPDLRSISAPGRILVARGVTERTVRLLILNPPRNQTGGPISFIVRMGGDAGPPRAEVLAVAGPQNQDRAFPGTFSVRFNRHVDDGHPLPPIPPSTGLPPAVGPLARLVAPFFPGGAALYPEEIKHVDIRGNGNAVYDIGDVRGYLFYHPQLIPTSSEWRR